MSGEQYFHCNNCEESWFIDPFDWKDDDYHGLCSLCGQLAECGDKDFTKGTLL